MKNIKNIIIVILLITLTVSVVLNFVNTTSVKNTKDAQASYCEKINNKINNSDYEITESDKSELDHYKDLSAENLAVLVSNKDYPIEFINLIAQNHGYVNYTDMCDKLINSGLLVYIPEYVHPEYGVIQETIVTPYTVSYELAVEAGIIEEVK